MSTLVATASPTSAGPTKNKSLLIADITLWSVFNLVYLVLAVVSLSSLHKSILRTPALALFSAYISSFLQTTVMIVYLAINLKYMVDNVHERIPYAFSGLFEDWALSLLFLSLVQILLDRLKHAAYPDNLQKTSRLAFSVLFAWAVLLFSACTVAGGIAVAAEIGLGSQDTITTGNSSSAVIRHNNTTWSHFEIAHYVLLGMWFCTDILVCVMVADVYSRAELSGVRDKVTNLTTFIAVHLYTLCTLEHIIFSVVLPPNKVLGNFDDGSIQPQHFVHAILSHVLRLATTVTFGVVSLGWAAWYWQTAARHRSHNVDISPGLALSTYVSLDTSR